MNYEAGLYFVGGALLVIALLLGASVLFRRKRLANPNAPRPRCAFRPNRLHLRGQHGQVLTAQIETDGPPGVVFATYVEEPWVVVSPAAGMFPQSVEVAVYTKHAPQGRRHQLTVRLLPVDGEAQFGSLDVTLHLKRTPGNAVGSRL